VSFDPGPPPAPPEINLPPLPVFGGGGDVVQALGAINPAAGPGPAGEPAFLAVYQGIGDVSFVADAEFTFALPRDAFVGLATDSDISFSATLDDGTQLPPWLHFDPATGNFIGDPPPGFTGAFTLKVTVHDGSGHAATAVFHLNIRTPGRGAFDETRPSPVQNALLPGDGPIGDRTVPRHAAVTDHWQDALAVHRSGLDLASGGSARGLDTPMGHGHDPGDAHPIGKPGLLAQLRAAGGHGFLSERAALLDSVRHRAAG
jgi:hypothetical protein